VSVTNDLLSNYQHLLTDLTIVTGGSGIFDVEVDGTMIFSKHKAGRFPKPGEVLEQFEQLLPQGTRRFGT